MHMVLGQVKLEKVLWAQTAMGKKNRVFKCSSHQTKKKMIIGEIMRLAVEILFKTYCYSFKGSVFKQSDGGPIGLRSTCAIARVVMTKHNMKWRQSMVKNNLTIEFNGFYVEDGRIVMFSLRPGWRWCNGGLWF